MIKRTLLILLPLVIILTSAILVKRAFSSGWFVSYLSLHKPASPELLIVEGWISKANIQLAAKEFNDMAYTRILTSGSPTDPYYLLYEDGYLEFIMENPCINLHKNDSISFTLKGSPVQGVYPEYMVLINTQKVFTGFTSGTWRTHSYILDSAICAEKISVHYINDTHHMGEDRNMYIKNLDVNGIPYPVRSERVTHFPTSPYMDHTPRPTHFASYAEVCAHELQKEGVPGQLIELVASPVFQKNRTLASALVISAYLEDQNRPLKQVNVISEGIHARRTWLSYKYALKNQTESVGIICAPSKLEENSDNPSYTREEILRELGSIVYYKFFFNKKRYRKTLTKQNPST